MNKKIKKYNQIVSIVENLKKVGKTVVAYSGAFDLLQSGHIKSLREAKEQGDFLIVLLNSDKSVKGYKGPNRPINSEIERAELLAALEMIDCILIFDELTPIKVLAGIRPNVYCSGYDWGGGCVERKTVEEYGGRIHVLNRETGKSTSKIIEKIVGIYEKPDVRAVFLDRDGVINENKPEYIHKIKDFRFKDGVINGLKKIQRKGYKLIIVTNQSGIARGYFKEKDLVLLNNWMLTYLKKRGVEIDKIYYCPHHTEFGNKKYKKDCDCRKPNIGFAEKAVKEFGISLNKSWVVGDDPRDILFGKKANTKTIFIGSDKNPVFSEMKIRPDYCVKKFKEVVKLILY